MNQKRAYRKGAVGALMDEYERAAQEFEETVKSIANEIYESVIDPHTNDANCRSIQTIVSHVVSAGYGYADYFRADFGIPSTSPEKRLLSKDKALQQLPAAILYMNETLEGRWEMTDEQITNVVIRSRWGTEYDMEQLLEHAIVHILRHRRQVDKFLQLAPTTTCE